MMSLKKNNRVIIMGVGLILLLTIGSYLRIKNLGVPSFWVDELNHFYAAKSIGDGNKPQLPSGCQYSRALPYTYLVILSMKLFGENEFFARFPSAIFGILAIPLVFWMGYKLFNIKIGLLSAFFLTFSPFEIGWSRVSKMYTLFQFLFLLGFYTFYIAFESKEYVKTEMSIRHGNLWQNSISRWGISWKWLFVSGLFLFVSLSVQYLTALFALGLFFYWFFMTIFIFFQNGSLQAIRSKYFWFLLASVIIGCILFLAVPGFKAKLALLSHFYPVWAQEGGAGGKLVYLEFLISEHMFPLGALFLIGAIQAIIRINRAGFYTLISFGMSILFLSFFVKTRVDRYMFNVYPLFLIIGAYGLFNIIKLETEVVKRTFETSKALKKYFSLATVQNLVIILMLCWIPISRWFYNSLKIPTVKSGQQYIGGFYTNGAVTHRDWREACNYVKSHSDSNDIIITTHALTVYHYLGTADFTIYSGDLGNFRDIVTDGKYSLEPYANVPVLKTSDDLQQVVTEHSKGWIIADYSRFSKMVPKEIVDFIQRNLIKHNTEAANTVLIYSWNRGN